MRRLLTIVLLTLAVSVQALPQRAPDEYQQQVLPVLAKSCMACHNDRSQNGGLSFEPYRDAAGASQKPELWQKVLDKVSARQMPPSSAPPLSAPELAAVTGWIRKLPAIAAASSSAAAQSPGRVTARRLNRIEYNNTIRDLLGVSLRPADEFPLDDSGYGFDSIGDVLTVSPLLMEKYLGAARTVSRAAVYGESYPEKPTLLVKLMSKKVQDDAPARGNVTPFSLRGAVYASFHAPVEAEYEFRIRYQNFRGTEIPAPAGRGARPSRDEQNRLAAPPIDLKFTVDGKLVYTTTIQGNADYNYARGEDIVRVKLSAGDHALRFSFPDYANVADPRKQLNPDGRRKLYVDYVDVVGPFGVTAPRPPGFSKIFICGDAGRYSSACESQIVNNLLMRAYRRAPTNAEIGKVRDLVAQVKKRDSFEEAIRVVTEALLISPNFLFRIEQDPRPVRGPAESYELNDYELASRLSYFLWSSMPDEELFRLAEQKRLGTPAILQAQVQRMLADPRALALAENFGDQWLNLRLMDRTKPDAARFGGVDDELLEAMRRETRMFVGSVFRENRSILDFIDGRYSYVNGPLARYYGIAGIDGEEFRRIELDGEQRSGIVTHGSILSISSYATRTSPVLRGKWVLDTLLGAAPPPPPDGIPPLEEKDLGTTASMRQRLEQHRADPACAACHNAMDPIGFGLENYDAAGQWRTKDGSFEIDNSGTLPDGRSFVGAKALKDVLKADAGLFARNFAEKLLTYALGRGLELSDRPVVDQISREFANDNYRFMTLVNQIVNSRPFTMRARS